MAKNSRKTTETSNVIVRAVLGTTLISYEELLHLQPDDILVLDQNIESSMDLVIQGEKKYLGIPGVYEQKRALKINGDKI